jgi:hypothetical protein
LSLFRQKDGISSNMATLAAVLADILAAERI